MPHVIINCAMSADGKIALPSRVQTRLSGEEDMARVHRLRAGVDAILVGVGTVLADDPSLTVKEKYAPGARSPLRIVLDSRGRTPRSAKVLDGRAKTMIAVAEGTKASWPGAEAFECGRGRVDLKELLALLDSRGVKRLLVEGGSEVIWSFLMGGYADELKVYVGSVVVGGAGSPTPAGGEGAKSIEDAVRLELLAAARLDSGVLLEYRVLK